MDASSWTTMIDAHCSSVWRAQPSEQIGVSMRTAHGHAPPCCGRDTGADPRLGDAATPRWVCLRVQSPPRSLRPSLRWALLGVSHRDRGICDRGVRIRRAQSCPRGCSASAGGLGVEQLPGNRWSRDGASLSRDDARAGNAAPGPEAGSATLRKPDGGDDRTSKTEVRLQPDFRRCAPRLGKA